MRTRRLHRWCLVGLAFWLVPAAGGSQPRPNQRRPRAERLYAMGVALGAAGNAPSAQSYLRRAISADPTYEEPYVALAELFIMREAWEDARSVLRTGRRYHDSSPRLSRLSIDLAQRVGDVMAAARAARHLVRVAPSDPSAHSLRAELARERGAWSEALTATRALLTLLRESSNEPSETRSARMAELESTIRALRVVVTNTDPVSRCVERPVRRALAQCGGSAD